MFLVTRKSREIEFTLTNREKATDKTEGAKSPLIFHLIASICYIISTRKSTDRFEHKVSLLMYYSPFVISLYFIFMGDFDLSKIQLLLFAVVISKRSCISHAFRL